MVVGLFLLGLFFLWIYAIYKVLQKKRHNKKLENDRILELAKTTLDLENLKKQQQLKKEPEIQIIKYQQTHIPNKKFENHNSLIGLSVNRITVNANSFIVFINIYNLTDRSININVKDSFFISNTKEQIKGIYNTNLPSNRIENNTIISGFNIIRELQFMSHKKTFDIEDAIIVTFSVDGYEFFLTESFDLIHNIHVELTNTF